MRLAAAGALFGSVSTRLTDGTARSSSASSRGAKGRRRAARRAWGLARRALPSVGRRVRLRNQDASDMIRVSGEELVCDTMKTPSLRARRPGVREWRAENESPPSSWPVRALLGGETALANL